MSIKAKRREMFSKLAERRREVTRIFGWHQLLGSAAFGERPLLGGAAVYRCGLRPRPELEGFKPLR